MSLPACLSIVVAVLTPAAICQCQFTNTVVQSYGGGCSAVFGFFPTLTASLDTSACSLQIGVNAYGGCCNTFLQATALVLGVQATALPLPELDPACVLHVQPDIWLLQLAPTPATFALPIPATLPPMAFLAQGAGLYYTTVSFPLPVELEFSLTAGYVIGLQ